MAGYTWDRYLEFISNAPPPQPDLDYFASVGWLRPYLQASGPYQPIPFFARVEKDDTSDRFFSRTLKTADTMPHALGLVRRGQDLQHRVATAGDRARPTAGVAADDTHDADFILLAHLRPDVSGFRDTAHGGFLGSLFDEAMGACVEMFRQAVTDRRASLFTANLNVSYRAPVELPGVVMVLVWLERRDGRKWYLRGKMVAENGATKADAESLWISTKVEGVL